MMNVMCVHNSFQVGTFRFKPDIDPAVNDDIMKHQVKYAIQGHTETDIHQPSEERVFRTNDNQAGRGNTENNSE
jgi:hypothetical protein